VQHCENCQATLMTTVEIVIKASLGGWSVLIGGKPVDFVSARAFAQHGDHAARRVETDGIGSPGAKSRSAKRAT